MKIQREYANLLPIVPDCHFYHLRAYDWSIRTYRFLAEVKYWNFWDMRNGLKWNIRQNNVCKTVAFTSWRSRSYNTLFRITDGSVCWNIAGFSVDTMFAVRHSKSVFTQSPLLLMSTLFLPQWDIMWNDMLSLSSLIWWMLHPRLMEDFSQLQYAIKLLGSSYNCITLSGIKTSKRSPFSIIYAVMDQLYFN